MIPNATQGKGQMNLLTIKATVDYCILEGEFKKNQLVILFQSSVIYTAFLPKLGASIWLIILLRSPLSQNKCKITDYQEKGH